MSTLIAFAIIAYISGVALWAVRWYQDYSFLVDLREYRRLDKKEQDELVHSARMLRAAPAWPVLLPGVITRAWRRLGEVANSERIEKEKLRQILEHEEDGY